MSFFTQQVIYCFCNQFLFYLLTEYIKLPVLIKRQQFKDSENNMIKLRLLKFLYMNAYNNKKKTRFGGVSR